MKGTVYEFGTQRPLAQVRSVVIYRNDTLWQSRTDSLGQYRMRFQRSADLYVWKSGYQMRYYRLARRRRPRQKLVLHRGMSGLLDTLTSSWGTRESRPQRLANLHYLHRSWGDITRLPQHETRTPQDLWQGQLPGLWTTHGSGLLDQQIPMRVRGGRSFYAFSEPLIVLDGLPLWQTPLSLPNNEITNPLLPFAPEELSTVQLLQDAAGTARWGARGGNGVLLLSSERQIPEGKRFRISYRAGISRPTVRPDMLSASQYDQLFEEAAQNAGFDADQIAFFRFNNQINDSTQTDWQNLPFRTGFFQQAELGFSEGDVRSGIRASLGFRQDRSHIVFHDQQRLRARFGVRHKVTQHWNMHLQFGSTYLLTSRVSGDIPLSLIAQIPSNPAYDPETGDPNPNTYSYNALFEEDGTQNEREIIRSIGTLRSEHTVTDWLRVVATVGVDVIRQREEVQHSPDTQRGVPDGLSYRRVTQAGTVRGGIDLLGEREFGKHHLRYALGTDYQYYDTDTLDRRFSRPLGFSLAQRERYAYGGFHGRLAYDFDERYAFTLSSRQERATTFGSANPWQNFSSLALGWTLSAEPFFRPVLDKINFLQLRASYGSSGNAQFDPAYAQGSLTGAQYGSDPALQPELRGNDALRPERNLQWDVGLRGAFAHDKIALEVSYFQQSVHDLLLNVPLPATSGYQTQWQNLGEIENRGWNVTLRTHNWERFWDWFTEINLSLLRTEVSDLNGRTLTGDAFILEEGGAFGQFYLREFVGVDTETGEALFRDAEGNPTTNPNAAPRRAIGQLFPSFWVSIRNRFEYEWLTVDMLWQGAGGHQLLDRGQAIYGNGFATLHNQTTNALDRWQQPGDVTDVPQLRLFDERANVPSSRWIQDADYLRLKRLRVGYRFPKAWLERFRARRAEAFVQGENLWTFTGLRHLDPEVSRWRGLPGENAILPTGQRFEAPMAWRVMLGVEVRF